jgi:hypothetical protein
VQIENQAIETPRREPLQKFLARGERFDLMPEAESSRLSALRTDGSSSTTAMSQDFAMLAL